MSCLVHLATVVSRKEQAERSRALLVATALEMFVERGYEQTSIADILEEAGMAKGALYHHFPDGKRSLFAAVVDVVDHDLHEAFEEIIGEIESPLEQIVRGMGALLELASDRAFGRIVLIEAAAVMPGAWEGGSEYQLLRANLERAMELGEIEACPLDSTAAALFGAARRSADHVARSSNPRQAAAQSMAVLEKLIDGLRPRPAP